jgi:hypothetical protein
MYHMPALPRQLVFESSPDALGNFRAISASIGRNQENISSQSLFCLKKLQVVLHIINDA